MADSIYTFDPTAINNSSLDSIPYGPNQLYHNKIDDLFRAYAAKLAQFVDDLGAANTVAGTADAITVTLASGITAYATGQLFRFIAGAANTGAATMNVNSIGAKAIRKISGGTDVALSAGDIAAGETYLVIYRASANAAAGAWVIIGSGASAASLAEVLAGTNATKFVTPATAYFPTGHLYGLTLTNSGSNDIVIAAGTARDASDSYNYISAGLTKKADTAWAVGTNQGSLDTGAVGNNRYAIWGVGRSDTRVCDVVTSLSFSSPTMPTNYDFKVLLGEFTRAGGVNGTPLWYGPRNASTGYAGVTLGSPKASTSGTSIDFTGIPAWAKRITLNFSGVSTNGTDNWLVQLGDSGGIEASGYLGVGGGYSGGGSASTSSTAGFLIRVLSATEVVHGSIFLSLVDPSTNTWTASGALSGSDGTVAYTTAGSKSTSAVLDRVRLTTTGGANTFDAGKVNISWE